MNEGFTRTFTPESRGRAKAIREDAIRRGVLYRSAAEAEELGFTVDRSCYPWVAYKGPRFLPTEIIRVSTPAWPGGGSRLGAPT